MFNNVGGKLKTLATISCWLGIAGSVIWGGILMGDDVVIGLVVMLAGSFASWVSSLMAYGIGEAVDKATEAAQKAGSYGRNGSANALSSDDKQLLSKLKEKDQEEEIQRKQDQAKEQKEILQKKFAESDGKNWVEALVEAISECERVSEVKEIWEKFPKDKDDALTQEVEKQIASAFQFERLYGVSKTGVAELRKHIAEIFVTME